MAKTNQILGGGFHHVAIRARDFDASVRFYSEALGFVEKIRWVPARNVRSCSMLAMEITWRFSPANESLATESPEPPILHFAIRTSDTNAAIARARAAGAVVTTEPKDVVIQSTPRATPVRLAFCKGPDGEIIEFFQNETT